MCGIAGFVGAGSREDIARMNAMQAWRGPDAEGIWADTTAGVYLGHQRLSIIDLACGAQPMWTQGGDIGVVFNGEIYNHVELRKALKAQGAIFVTDHSDTEVLLHGYRIWGDAFVDRLNGMWAFVIYDRKRQRLFASRDRFGKKPFYYAHRPGFFAFSSELTSLTSHPAVPNRISQTALRKFFAYGYIPAPHSIVEGVRKLPGGHSLIYDIATGVVRVTKYWDFCLEPFETIPADAENAWCEELRSLIRRAVKRRLISDVPIGAFLSGGVDSSAIAAFAARELDAGRLNTYSISFQEPTFDESAYARQAADLVGSNHHVKTLSIDVARQVIPSVLSRLDEPLGDSSLLPTYLLCGFAREHVTVALGGDGGDELFAGYDPFRALRWADMYQKLVPKPVHKAISLLIASLPVSHRNMSVDFKLKRTLRGLDHASSLWCPVWMAPLGPADLESCFRESIDLEDVYSEAIEQWDACKTGTFVDRTLQFYTKLYLQDDILTKVDRASMMHSLEVRAPFLDIELVDFVRRIPWQYKLRGGETKYLLKKALEPILPKNILYRSKKGFGVPIGPWFKSGSVTLADARLPGIEPQCVRERLEAHQNGRADERAFLWGTLAMGSYVRRLDRSDSQPAGAPH
jgi:asparagine synthase (glutamine-hydrolysing)